MATTPKLWELTSGIKTLLDASDYLEDNTVSVIVSDGLQDKAVERQLRKRGVVVVVLPVQSADARDQAGQTALREVTLAVRVMVNPYRNADTDDGGAGINVYRLVHECIDAVIATTSRHPGGEFYRLIGFSLNKQDAGEWSYDIGFTKEVLP
jgi:hypothetical protein